MSNIEKIEREIRQRNRRAGFEHRAKRTIRKAIEEAVERDDRAILEAVRAVLHAEVGNLWSDEDNREDRHEAVEEWIEMAHDALDVVEEEVESR